MTGVILLSRKKAEKAINDPPKAYLYFIFLKGSLKANKVFKI